MTRRIALGALIALLTASAVGPAVSPPAAAAFPPRPSRPEVVYGPPNDLPEQIAASVADASPADVTDGEGAVPVVADSPPPEPEPPVSLTIRERALLTFVAEGAPGWVIRGFDCIGDKESGWQAIRSTYPNADGSYDHGPLQFNDAHWPRLNRLGLNPYVPEDAAHFAMILWRESGFGPWAATRGKCGV